LGEGGGGDAHEQEKVGGRSCVWDKMHCGMPRIAARCRAAARSVADAREAAEAAACALP